MEPKTAADFTALIDEARAKGEAPIDRHIEDIHVEDHPHKTKVRLVGTNMRLGKPVKLSSWQDTEEQAVHCAIARAFC